METIDAISLSSAMPCPSVSLDSSEYCIVLVSAKCRAWYIDHKLLHKQSHSHGTWEGERGRLEFWSNAISASTPIA